MISCCHAALMYEHLRCYGCMRAVYVIHVKSERNTGNLCVWSYSLPPADGLRGQECKRCRSFTFLVALFTFLTALAISRRQRIRSNAKVSCKTKCGCVDTFAECLQNSRWCRTGRNASLHQQVPELDPEKEPPGYLLLSSMYLLLLANSDLSGNVLFLHNSFLSRWYVSFRHHI